MLFARQPRPLRSDLHANFHRAVHADLRRRYCSDDVRRRRRHCCCDHGLDRRFATAARAKRQNAEIGGRQGTEDASDPVSLVGSWAHRRCRSLLWEAKGKRLFAVQALVGHRIKAINRYFLHHDEATIGSGNIVKGLADGRYGNGTVQCSPVSGRTQKRLMPMSSPAFRSRGRTRIGDS